QGSGGPGALRTPLVLHPAKQYVQPFSWERFTAITPEGTTRTPGSRLATQSFLMASACMPISFANRILLKVRAMLHTPMRTPFASNSSVPMPGIGTSPGLRWMRGCRMAGPFVAGSVILNASPNLYFAHMALSIAYGIPEWRSTITTVLSASVVPYVSLVVLRNTRDQANAKPSCGSGTSYTILCLPVILFSHASNSGFADVLPGAGVGCAGAPNGATSPPRPKAAALAAMRPRKPRRCVVKWPTSNMRPPIEWER